jgi:hypothetical protein
MNYSFSIGVNIVEGIDIKIAMAHKMGEVII